MTAKTNPEDGSPPEQKKPTPDGSPPPTDASAPAEATDANKLSKEEQMALYEKELKENDWGHQPC